jgi:uncharacterized ferredoxin-like protein
MPAATCIFYLSVRACGPRNLMKAQSVTALFSAPDCDFRACQLGPAARETSWKAQSVTALFSAPDCDFRACDSYLRYG